MPVKKETEFWVASVDEHGDIIDQWEHDELAAAQREFDTFDLDSEAVAVFIEQRQCDWCSVRGKIGSELYRVLAVRGDAASLAAGGWSIQTELQSAGAGAPFV